jgi:hypothetical protein
MTCSEDVGLRRVACEQSVLLCGWGCGVGAHVSWCVGAEARCVQLTGGAGGVAWRAWLSVGAEGISPHSVRDLVHFSLPFWETPLAPREVEDDPVGPIRLRRREKTKTPWRLAKAMRLVRAIAALLGRPTCRRACVRYRGRELGQADWRGRPKGVLFLYLIYSKSFSILYFLYFNYAKHLYVRKHVASTCIT